MTFWLTPFLQTVGSAVGIAGALKDLSDGGKKQSGVPNYKKIVSSAEAAGIHPLEALRAGGFGPDQRQPRVASFTALRNSFDLLDDAISGTKRKDQELQEVNLALAKLDLEAARRTLATPAAAGLASGGNVINRAPTEGPISFKGPRLSVATNAGVVPFGEVSDPVPVTPYGNVDFSINDGGTGSRIMPRGSWINRNGSKVDLPTEDLDLDSMVIAGGLEAVSGRRDDGEAAKIGEMIAKKYQQETDAKAPLRWDDRFGRRRPREWNQWSNSTKYAWIVRNNKLRDNSQLNSWRDWGRFIFGR